PVETNIIIFHLNDKYSAKQLVDKLKEEDILGHAISPTSVRLVTHLDITEEMIAKTIDTIEKL
ncbi:MAG: threonine aldolase, partial [Chitinophagaceae bacterium]